MALIRPRLTDYYGIQKSQSEVDFAIPFFDTDIPLYVDPFLIWKSPSFQDNSLHAAIMNSFNSIGFMANNGNDRLAVEQVVTASECSEVGLGTSGNRKGRRISFKQSELIVRLFMEIPHLKSSGFLHIEEVALLVDGIGKDIVSDFACSYMKSFLIDYTTDQCNALGIPTKKCSVDNVYDLRSRKFTKEDGVSLPVNPANNEVITLVPKRWLRFGPWINFDNYFKNYCPYDDAVNPGQKYEKVKILDYNRHNYGAVLSYVKEKERTASDCANDPLFSQIPVISAKKKMSDIKKLPTGKTENADKKYEDAICQILSSMLYPALDFAADQVRSESGVSIRDLVMYNTRSNEFLDEIYTDYKSRQIIFELKNVSEVERDHINQLNRYMNDEIGLFSVLVTRNPLKKTRLKSTIDLWSGQRRCIITLTDADIEQMVDLYESKQRSPLDVIKKKYVEFKRKCPL